jgi:hypothetical protein
MTLIRPLLTAYAVGCVGFALWEGVRWLVQPVTAREGEE